MEFKRDLSFKSGEIGSIYSVPNVCLEFFDVNGCQWGCA